MYVPDPRGSDGDGGNRSEMESAPAGESAKPRESEGWAGVINSLEWSSSTITLDTLRIGDVPMPASAPARTQTHSHTDSTHAHTQVHGTRLLVTCYY